jgi:hypothetical protein
METLESVCVPESPNESCHQFAIAGALSSATIFVLCSLHVKLLYYPAGLWRASRGSCLSSRSKKFGPEPPILLRLRLPLVWQPEGRRLLAKAGVF